MPTSTVAVSEPPCLSETATSTVTVAASPTVGAANEAVDEIDRVTITADTERLVVTLDEQCVVVDIARHVPH